PREGDQPRPRPPPRQGLPGPLPLGSEALADRAPERAALRGEQHPQAPRRAPRRRRERLDRPVLVGPVVRRLARAAAGAIRRPAGGASADLAAPRGLAPCRPAVLVLRDPGSRARAR